MTKSFKDLREESEDLGISHHHGKWEKTVGEHRHERKKWVAKNEDGTHHEAVFSKSTTYSNVGRSRVRNPGRTRYSTHVSIKHYGAGGVHKNTNNVSFGSTVGEHKRDTVAKHHVKAAKWAHKHMGIELGEFDYNH